MQKPFLSPGILFVTLLFILPPEISAQEPVEKNTTAFPDAEKIVRELYTLVTVKPGKLPDWNRVRSLFIEPAVVVLRTSREASTVFTVDGFVQDFVSFIENFNVLETGFTEKVIKTKNFILGDIAQITVVYEASIPGSERPPQTGVDSFQLIRTEEGWRIVSVINEIPTPQRPLPDELK